MLKSLIAVHLLLFESLFYALLNAEYTFLSLSLSPIYRCSVNTHLILDKVMRQMTSEK